MAPEFVPSGPALRADPAILSSFRTQKSQKHSRKTNPRGFSLLEVVLALAIATTFLLLVSLLHGLGVRSAMSAQSQTRAQLLCESVLAQVVAGALSSDPVQQAPLTNAFPLLGTESDYYMPVDLQNWVYSVELEPVVSSTPDLMALRVTVEELVAPGQDATVFSLTRWIPDPNVVLAEEQSVGGAEDEE